MTRVRRVESQRGKEKLVDEYLTRGYKIKNQGHYSIRLKDQDWGDIYVHIFLGIFGLVAGAVAADVADLPAGTPWLVVIIILLGYATYSWFTAEEIVIKVASSSRTEDSSTGHHRSSNTGGETSEFTSQEAGEQNDSHEIRERLAERFEQGDDPPHPNE